MWQWQTMLASAAYSSQSLPPSELLADGLRFAWRAQLNGVSVKGDCMNSNIYGIECPSIPSEEGPRH
jgi:hypothetical protein